MATSIDHYRNIGFDTSRVGLGQGGIVNARTSRFGRIIGIVTRSRRRENKKVYDDFKRSLKEAYGDSGIRALNQLTKVRGRSLSSEMIRQVVSEAGNPGNAPSAAPGSGRPEVVSNLAQWQSLQAIDLKPGDILIKKVFDQEKKDFVESGITTAQGLFEKPEKVKVDGEVYNFPLLGHHSSEHAAVVLTGGRIAEAEKKGIGQFDLSRRAHVKYIVFRPKVAKVAEEIGQVADTFSQPKSKGGKYSLWGAIKSSFRDAINSPGKKAQVIGSGMRFLQTQNLGEQSTKRPNMFCSEFAAMCVEIAGNKVAHPENKNLVCTLGVSPRAVSPMVLEDLLNQRPDLFEMVGRYHGESMPPVQQKRETESAPGSVKPDGQDSGYVVNKKALNLNEEVGYMVGLHQSAKTAANVARFEKGLKAYTDTKAAPSSDTVAERATRLWKDENVQRIAREQYGSTTPEGWVKALEKLGDDQARFELDILDSLSNDPNFEHNLKSGQHGLVESIRAQWKKGADSARAWYGREVNLRAVQLASERDAERLAASNDSAPNAASSNAASPKVSGEALLRSLNLPTVSIPGDGHCLYASLACSDGDETRRLYEAQPMLIAQETRTALLETALSLTDEQLEKLVAQDRAPGAAPLSGEALEEAKTSWLTSAVLEVARGIDVAAPSQEAWGTYYSLSLAAISFERPVIAVGVDGSIDQFEPDGSKVNTIPGNTASLNKVLQDRRSAGVSPLLVYQQSPAHFQSFNYPPAR